MHGNKKGGGEKPSRCGNMVQSKNADGTVMKDEEGNVIMQPCGFLIESAKRREMRKLQRDALLQSEPRLPESKKMKYSNLEKSFTSLMRKVKPTGACVEHKMLDDSCGDSDFLQQHGYMCAYTCRW